MTIIKKITNALICGIVITGLFATAAFGSGESNPRAMAMGGAYTALARDIEAPYWNPANLGLSDGKGFTINFVNVGLDLKNNSFSLADYNKYNGKFLTDKDKNDILNSIPSDGLNLNCLVEASALNFSIGNFAVTSRGFGATSFSIDKDPFELFFYGNAVKNDVSLADTKGEAYGIGDAALSYGQAVRRWPGGEFTVGASFHYLQGLAYEKVVETQGGISTTDTGFVGSGLMRLHSALGGSGYSADLGVAVRFNENWYFSAGWQNLYSKINWTNQPEEMLFTFQMDPITISGMSDNNDSLVTNSDTTYAINGFSTTLPGSLKFGLARKYRKITWALDWDQSLSTGQGRSTNPRISGGLEYRPIGLFPMRIGMGLGGNQGASYSAGFGLYMGPCHMDFAVANAGSPSPSHTKGAKFAFGMGLYF